MKSKVLVWATLGTALVLFGCGGGGGNPGGTAKLATFVTAVAWPQRTRDINAPGSALSSVVEVDVSETEFDARTVDRPDGLAPVRQTVNGSKSLTVGPATLRVRLYAQPSGQGSLVGSADVAVRLMQDGSLAKPDGTALGDVAVTGTVASVVVAAGQSLSKGQTIDLTATASDSHGNPLALTPGSFKFQITSGSAYASITDDGKLTGVAAGAVKVVATVDGIASAETDVTVQDPTQLPVVRSYALAIDQVDYDAVDGRLYASVRADAASNPNCVIKINPATGAVEGSVFVGSGPDDIRVAKDGSMLWVALDGAGAMRRVDLPAMTASTQFSLETGSNLYVDDFEVLPNSPSSVIVCRATPGISPRGSGVAIYDNGVRRTRVFAPFGGQNVVEVDENGTYAYSHTNEVTSFTLTRMRIDPDGPTSVEQKDGLISTFGQNIAYAGGRLYASGFDVFSVNPFAKAGTFPDRRGDSQVLPDPTNDYVYTITWGSPSYFSVYSKTTFTKVKDIAVDGISGGVRRLVKVGPSTFAFSTTDGQLFVVDNVRLP